MNERTVDLAAIYMLKAKTIYLNRILRSFKQTGQLDLIPEDLLFRLVTFNPILLKMVESMPFMIELPIRRKFIDTSGDVDDRIEFIQSKTKVHSYEFDYHLKVIHEASGRIQYKFLPSSDWGYKISSDDVTTKVIIYYLPEYHRTGKPLDVDISEFLYINPKFGNVNNSMLEVDCYDHPREDIMADFDSHGMVNLGYIKRSDYV